MLSSCAQLVFAQLKRRDRHSGPRHRTGATVPLSTWFNNHKPTLFPSGDGLITGDGHQLTGQQLSLVWR